MSKSIYHTPYTYLIKFKPTGQVYYGVRFAKGCSPDDLWETYFTSSKVVKSLIEEHGKDAFDYEIRKTFETADAARKWEENVLQRLKVVKDDKWLNKTDNKSFIQPKNFKHSPESIQKIIDSKVGYKFSKESREKMSKSHIGQTPWNKGITYDKPTRKKGRPLSEEHKKALRKPKQIIKQKCELCGNYYNPGYMKSLHPKYCKGEL